MILEPLMRNAALEAVFDNADSGTLVFHTSAHAEVATCTFGATAFAAASGGQITANAITKDSSTTAGTIEHAHVMDGATELCELSCGVSSSEINLTSLVFAAGEELSITSLIITMPAS